MAMDSDTKYKLRFEITRAINEIDELPRYRGAEIIRKALIRANRLLENPFEDPDQEDTISDLVHADREAKAEALMRDAFLNLESKLNSDDIKIKIASLREHTKNTYTILNHLSSADEMAAKKIKRELQKVMDWTTDRNDYSAD
jgi:hypothetical protein